MKLSLRRTVTIVEERREEAGVIAENPLRRVAVVAIVQNPYASTYVDDLSPLFPASAELGHEMAKMAVASLGTNQVQSYGKGGVAGMLGEQEHVNALLTTTFADPFRALLTNANAWISSFTKVGAPGTSIDIPMNHIADVRVRSHYDGMSIVVPDAPQPDEIMIVFCLATRGRLNARVGGMTHEEAQSRLIRATSQPVQ